MNISNHWLRQYVDHGLSAEELAERLTMLGLEVEAVEQVGSDLDGVVIGRVDNVREHPNADRLVLCDVSLNKDDPVQIICGAPNVRSGQMVPVATVGSTLSNGDDVLTVRQATIRGEESHGMICSEAELGLSEDAAGIMVLDEDAKVGEQFSRYLDEHFVSARDDVFEIDITPNRPDATSHIGVARDVAAWTGKPLSRPEVTIPQDQGDTADHISLDLKAPDACPRYVGVVVKDVTVRESPLWLRRRLTAIGLRPRNNIVDATNFVMHECGQPLHAFDLDQLADQTIVVKTADAETPFVTLDGEEHEVPEGSLFICDAQKPVALAGIMGGANSEVSDETTSILIESAYFDPSTIRRTAKALGLSTDSSYRFERGIDTNIQKWAAARAAQLIAELADGTIVPGYAEEVGNLPAPATLTLNVERANSLLGTDLSSARMSDLLSSLEFDVEAENGMLRCTAPTFRPDVSREVDLIEEIGRLHGYDEIHPSDTISVPAAVPHPSAEDEIRDKARAHLTGLGFREIYTNSMLPIDEADTFNAPELQGGVSGGPIVQTLKPISQQMAALRPSLLPGMLSTMQHNHNHGQDVLRFWELGHVFRKTDRSDTVVPGYAEHRSLLIGLSGSRAPTTWSAERQEADFFDLKGVLSSLLEHLRLVPRFRPTERTHELTQFQVDVFIDETVLGSAFQLSADASSSYDLDGAPPYFAELDWSSLSELAAGELHRWYQPIARFPVVERDLAVVLREDQPVGPLLKAIRESGSPLLQKVDVFDLYTGEHVPDEMKSIAFALRFGASRTLTDEEVDDAIKRILNRLKREFSVSLRS